MELDLDLFGNESTRTGPAERNGAHVQDSIDLLDLGSIPTDSRDYLQTKSNNDKSLPKSAGIDLLLDFHSDPIVPNRSVPTPINGDSLFVNPTIAKQDDADDLAQVSLTEMKDGPDNLIQSSAMSSSEHQAEAQRESQIGIEPQNSHQSESESSKVANPSNYQTTRNPESNLFKLIDPYCDVNTLLALSSTSRQARAAAVDESIWKPICIEVGFADKIENEGSLLSLASATNVLELGYLPGDQSAYRTFVRAFNLLHRSIVAPLESTEPLNHLERASTLGNAWKMVRAINHREEISTGSVDVQSNDLASAIEKSKKALMSEIADMVDQDISVPPSILRAVDIWSEKTEDEELVGQAIETYLSKFPILLDVEDAFIYYNDSDTRTKQVSQRKVEASFSSVASSLIQIMAQVNDSSSPIPQHWRSLTWSSSLSKFMGAIAVYLQDILEVSSKEISELEYLLAVPRLHAASKVLSTNSVLIENGGDAGFDVSKYVNLIIMRPIIEEFCERQTSYVQKYARERVNAWNESVVQRENETEEFLWSSVPKKSDKNNFISSFKWAFISADEADDKLANERDISSAIDGAFPTDSSAPATEFEAQTAVLVSKLRGMESLVSIELAIDVLETCRAAFRRLKVLGRANAEFCEPLFCFYLDVIGKNHIQVAFEKAIKVLNSYDPKRYGRLMISVGDHSAKQLSRQRLVNSVGSSSETGHDHDYEERMDFEAGSENEEDKNNAVEPLAVFTELVNIGDLVQQMVHVFFEEELVGGRIVRQSDFGAPSVNAKRRFEQMLDDMLAEGLSRGIDVLMDQVDFTLRTEQLGSDFMPLPTQEINVGPTAAAQKVINLVRSHLDLLRESTEKSLFDVFQQEVGVRLYASLSKHMKRQIISVDGAVNLISDVNAYYSFIVSLRQKNLQPYYETLKQISQLYLIDKKDAKQIGYAISDSGRFNGVVGTEDIIEFIKRRQDWPEIKPKVEKVLYGVFECIIC